MKYRLLYSLGGVENFGDDYILDLWIMYYTQNRKDLKIYVARPEVWMSGIYHNFNNVVFLIHLHSMFWDVHNNFYRNDIDVLKGYIDAGRAVSKNLLDNSSPYRELIMNVEAFHCMGGGYLNSFSPHEWGIVSIFASLAEALNVPMYGTGLGLVPVPPEHAGMIPIMNRFSLLESRDKQGYQDVRDIYPETHIVKGSDDSFLDSVKQDSSYQVEDSTVFICIQSDYNGNSNYEIMLNKINKFINSINSKINIVYLLLHDESDSIFLNLIKENIEIDIKVFNERDLIKNGLPISKKDFCITSRFHLHLLAARLGARGAYVWTGDEYYAAKHQSILALGSHWLNFLSDEISMEKISTAPYPEIEENIIVEEKQALINRYVLGSSSLSGLGTL